MKQSLLWYFADPMCSWCWGFSPVITRLKETYKDQLNTALVLGGLRPGGKDPVTPQFREDILHHWQEVHKMTGQPFSFKGAMPEGFVYDTEPASRAVITVSAIRPEMTFPYFTAIQSAFYTENVDVTREEELLSLAMRYQIASQEFTRQFGSVAMKETTQQHFQKAREFGVQGFPTLVLRHADKYHLIGSGYLTFEDASARLEAILAG